MLLKDNAFVKKKYWRILLASIMGYVITLTSEMVDSIFAGNLIDPNAVAGIELVTPIEYIYYGLVLLPSVSVGILYTRALGKHDKLLSQKIAGMGLCLSLSLGLFFGLLCYFGAEWFVSFYPCSESIAYYAVAFLKYKAFQIPFYFLYFFLYTLVEFDGDEVLCLICDVVLVVFVIGIPYAMGKTYGFVGIALSYAVVYALGCLLLLPHFAKKRNSISFKPYFSFSLLKEMCKTSSTIIMTNIYIAIVDIGFNAIIVNIFGDTTLPAYTVVNFALNIAETLTATAASAEIFISVCYGEGSYKEIRSIFKFVLNDCLLLALGMAVALVVAAPYWPAIFAIEDAYVAELAVFAGRIIPLSFFFSCFVYNFMFYYPIVEKPLYGNLLSLFYMLVAPFLICAPVAYFWGFKAMIIAFAVTPAFALAATLGYIFLTKHRKDFPFFLPENKEKEYHYNIELDKKNIVALKDQVLDTLSKEQIAPVVLHEVSIVVEDALVHIQEANKNKVVAEITLLLNDEHMRLIMKDNGRIFDLVQEMQDAKTFRAYAMDRLTSMTYEKENDVAISFNRNMFSWDNKLT